MLPEVLRIPPSLNKRRFQEETTESSTRKNPKNAKKTSTSRSTTVEPKKKKIVEGKRNGGGGDTKRSARTTPVRNTRSSASREVEIPVLESPKLDRQVPTAVDDDSSSSMASPNSLFSPSTTFSNLTGLDEESVEKEADDSGNQLQKEKEMTERAILAVPVTLRLREPTGEGGQQILGPPASSSDDMKDLREVIVVKEEIGIDLLEGKERNGDGDEDQVDVEMEALGLRRSQRSRTQTPLYFEAPLLGETISSDSQYLAPKAESRPRRTLLAKRAGSEVPQLSIDTSQSNRFTNTGGPRSARGTSPRLPPFSSSTSPPQEAQLVPFPRGKQPDPSTFDRSSFSRPPPLRKGEPKYLEPREQLPKNDLDFYSPRFVRGGTAREANAGASIGSKEGWCSLCKTEDEFPERGPYTFGGWLPLRNSTYRYHQTRVHGLNPRTLQPLEAPSQTRLLKGSSGDALVGQCHACQ